MCSQLFFILGLSLIENKFIKSVINKELHAIFVQFGIKQTLLVFKNMIKLPSLRSGNFIMFLKTKLGYLSQIVLKNTQLLAQITGVQDQVTCFCRGETYDYLAE